MTPLFKAINEKIDKIMEELSNSPGTNEVRDAIYASAQYRAGTARWGMAIRTFMESADENSSKTLKQLRVCATGA